MDEEISLNSLTQLPSTFHSRGISFSREAYRVVVRSFCFPLCLSCNGFIYYSLSLVCLVVSFTSRVWQRKSFARRLRYRSRSWTRGFELHLQRESTSLLVRKSQRYIEYDIIRISIRYRWVALAYLSIPGNQYVVMLPIKKLLCCEKEINLV